MTAPLQGWYSSESPYHRGEQLIQRRLGVRERMEEVGRRVIRPFMPDQHRGFFSELPFLVIGSIDARRRPWASIVVGMPGFLRSPNPNELQVHGTCVWADPLCTSLARGAPLGVLGVQLETRRRNRMNGSITALDRLGFSIGVGQSFGNCPKYIQARKHRFIEEPSSAGYPRPVDFELSRLSGRAVDMITRADTFFIATASPAAGRHAVEGVDVSHRGGRAGFVKVTEQDGCTILTSPDFVGNFFFNTMGNIVINPSAGLLFIDFQDGTLLSLTGQAEVVWDGPELESFIGAERLLKFRVEGGFAIPKAVPLRWSEPELAPQLTMTGSWQGQANAM